jgi:hypothetical protein
MAQETDSAEDPHTWEFQLPLTVLPKAMSQEDLIRQEIGKLLIESSYTSATQKQWKLPTTWNGQVIQWEEVLEDHSLLIFMIGLIVAILVFFLSDKDLQGKTKIRQNQMMEDYPLMVNKLVLYLGAGMTIRGAWLKMTEKYQSMHNTKTTRPAYDEMVYTGHEITTGVPEAMAYERFGQRIGLPAFVKLSNLLAQNIVKGNQTLLLRMREEAWAAMDERLNRRKKLGEEAATKLLLPMMMMLGIVMVLIMIPAFTSLGA